MVVALTRVGLLGSDAADVAGLARDAGVDPVVENPVPEDGRSGSSTRETVDALVALGEDALLDVAEADVSAPVLPVGAGAEYGGVPREALQQALDALAGGRYETTDRPTLAVRMADSEWRALADAMLVTTEPSQISEFAIRAGGERVDEVRADGVVAATPAGSHGYAAAAGGPLLQDGTDAVAVVPVSPFRVGRVQWVLDAPVSITVTREESAVSLFVDGRERASVAPHESVELDWGAPLSVAVVPESRRASGFDR